MCIRVFPNDNNFFSHYIRCMDKQEHECAELIVACAIDYVTTYLDYPEDWDAGVCGLLATALEIASGRKLKPLEEIYV